MTISKKFYHKYKLPRWVNREQFYTVRNFLRRWWAEIVLIPIGFTFAVAVIYFIFEPPQWLWTPKTDKNNADNVEMLKVFILGLGGIGALYGLILSSRRTRNDGNQLFNDRLGRGVELIASKDVTTRSSGVRVLDDLAETANPQQKKLIVNILRDYLNIKAKITKNEKGKTIPETPKPREQRTDIELCVKAILKYAIGDEQRQFQSLDLRELDFAYTNLSHAEFSNVNLAKANLPYANLTGTKLPNGDLTEINLWSANLARVNLTDADLTRAKLEKANMKAINLWGADLTKAELAGANLTGAELSKADLTEAELWKANLTDANLTGADLTSANLSETNLAGANLTGAELTGTNLAKTNLIQKQLDEIIYKKSNPPKNIPHELTPPEDRAYIQKWGGEKNFVKSDKPWSEQNVLDNGDDAQLDSPTNLSAPPHEINLLTP